MAFEEWIVFKHEGRELCSYTRRGTFPGEREATINQLAHDNGIPAEEITVTVENRRRSAYPGGYPN